MFLKFRQSLSSRFDNTGYIEVVSAQINTEYKFSGYKIKTLEISIKNSEKTRQVMKKVFGLVMGDHTGTCELYPMSLHERIDIHLYSERIVTENPFESRIAQRLIFYGNEADVIMLRAIPVKMTYPMLGKTLKVFLDIPDCLTENKEFCDVSLLNSNEINVLPLIDNYLTNS